MNGFPNAARVLVAAMVSWQGDLDPEDRWESGGVTPLNLQDRLPFVRVSRAGGPTEDIQDFPLTRVEVWDRSLARAEDVAEAIRVRLAGSYIRNEHGLLDRTTCVSLHQEVPDEDNPDLRRVVTTYQHACRRLPATG